MFKLSIGIDLLLLTRNYVSFLPNIRREVLVEFRPLAILGPWLDPKRPAAGPLAAE